MSTLMQFSGDMRDLVPANPRPVVLIGAGSIVRDGHLPAYKGAGIPVAGIFDINRDLAEKRAAQWDIGRVFGSLIEAISCTPNAVFDLATPPAAHGEVLSELPEGSAVLVQKPMGRDLAEASTLLDIARSRKLLAAMNFQMRFAPAILKLRDTIAKGKMGEIVDVEFHVNVHTPWDMFDFVAAEPRIELSLHSIHYIDLIRALLGEPLGVHARTLSFPRSELAATRTAAILDYGDAVRVMLSVNHHHNFGRRFQDASMKVEGTKGAAVVQFEAVIDYPNGGDDALWLNTSGEWKNVAVKGTWFPDAFVGPMANLQSAAAGKTKLESPLDDAWRTMAVVEACFESSASPANPIRALDETTYL